MKNKILIRKIQELRSNHIEMIDAGQGINETCGLASDYNELIHTIADLLKTSQEALEGMHSVPEPKFSEIEYNIADVIGIAIKLLPFPEMQFIDEVFKLLDTTQINPDREK